MKKRENLPEEIKTTDDNGGDVVMEESQKSPVQEEKKQKTPEKKLQFKKKIGAGGLNSSLKRKKVWLITSVK